jgi:hypothetical protein
MLSCVAVVRTDVSEELSASFIRVARIGELGTTLAVTSNRRTLRRKLQIIIMVMEMLGSSEMLVLTRSTRCNIPENGILHSHRRETSNIKWSDDCFE